jgi:hypothetical protein
MANHILTMRGKGLLLFICLAAIVGIASAGSVVQTNSITTHSPLGMLIPLGIENWVPAADAIMYYTYISFALIALLAALSGMSNESRFLVLVPYFTAGLIFIGWLQAPNPQTYWGMVIAMCLLGTLIYVNDMNREKFGTSGPGTKVMSVAILIIIFEASIVLMNDPAFSPIPGLVGSGSEYSAQQFCSGYGYSCDSSGKVDLSASVTTVSSSGGTLLDVASLVSWAAQAAFAALRFIVLIIGAVVAFSVVITATYPVLLTSPQAMLILGIMQLVIWVIYIIAWTNWTFKPSYETLQV